MTSKIVDIIAKILEGLSNNASIEDVNQSLLKSKQFDEHLLSVAFSLIYDKIILKNKKQELEQPKTPKSIRMLTEEENEILGVDNYNYLLHLFNVGLLDSSNIEAILDQVSLFPESKISRREINWIILLSLVEYNSELLPGSRFLLYSSDTVN